MVLRGTFTCHTSLFNNPQIRLKCIQVDTVDTSEAQVLVISLRYINAQVAEDTLAIPPQGNGARDRHFQLSGFKTQDDSGRIS